MRKSWLLCVLLGTLAWGQAAPGTPPPAQAEVPGNVGKPQAPTAPPDTSAAVPPEAPVITVNGVCPAKPKPVAAQGTTATPAKPASEAKTAAATTSSADCKTVITKAQFEKLASGVAPNMTPQLRKQLAGVLPRLIAMSNAAEKKGLDKTPRFAETMKFAKMQILTNELQRTIQEEAAKVPPEDIASYYKEHPETFEQFNLDRLFVPRTKQGDAEAKEEDEKDQKPSEEAQKAKQAEEKAKADEAEQAMTRLAESLHARAAAGEDFVKLQKEAFDAAGMKIDSPTVNLPKVRRTGLPPAHAAVFDLKAGEVSQIISDSGGHYIYKVNVKEQLPLDQVQVKDEIHSKLQNDRTREMMDKVNRSFKVETNEMYFGPGGPATAPPPRIPNPRMVPSPTTPQAQPQTPPPPQPQAAKPN
jgi:hypothetical protein